MQRIGNIVDMKKSTVQSIIERINKTGSPIMPRHSTGTPKKLNERDLRILERIVRKDTFFSYNQILYELRLSQIHISRPTLVKYLYSLGFSSYFAAHKPDLKPKHILAALA
ncbi:Homeodomain-like DNA binding domain-containing transcription factor [Mucor lusitanicus CBS 277.49]|uniref:Homeodomain-like DNA binding domain-containing transcription factor n=1 Tax=Mucor lusitanicus CBS 277.49 TaxID=747725 RepID=A0A168LZ05_MUCCL|nr:Homeodomain-like DNA binding domain-containing transcription factor [Mucor lusitanicus CBS 277.49]